MSSRADANLRENLRRWDQEYSWPADGDEWDGQAALCGVAYADWKASLVAHLIAANLTGEEVVVEIAPGHGRWTEHLLQHARSVTVVDMSPSCLDYCAHRFADAQNLSCVLTSGTTLPGVTDAAVDVVWSYDAFVHMAPDVVRAYLEEIHRVLRPGGQAVLHHSHVERPDEHDQDAAPGWRSAMTAERMREFALAAGLRVESQFVYWDEARQIGVPRFNDRITTLRR